MQCVECAQRAAIALDENARRRVFCAIALITGNSSRKLLVVEYAGALRRRPLRCPDFFVKSWKIDSMLFAFFDRARTSGQHWRSAEKNGDVTGACWSKSMIIGKTDDTGDK
ncbi:unnamed protein product [Nippostrongylus brasiliensis]|uniref:Uncharacterized protein n=1 Tax=Nippostrongylus brasiliensis TaxID=27835 RepID=A0A0N4YCE0_NIPBR|nr:unnamed protein product [Nippostrongylus brasiliensis]